MWWNELRLVRRQLGLFAQGHAQIGLALDLEVMDQLAAGMDDRMWIFYNPFFDGFLGR